MNLAVASFLPATFFVEPSPASDPKRAYRDYLAAIRRRDIEAVLEAMTDDYGRQWRALRRTRDFGPTFDLWCANQAGEVEITAVYLDGDMAVLESQDGDAFSRIEMHYVDGGWRVAGEQYLRAKRMLSTG